MSLEREYGRWWRLGGGWRAPVEQNYDDGQTLCLKIVREFPALACPSNYNRSRGGWIAEAPATNNSTTTATYLRRRWPPPSPTILSYDTLSLSFLHCRPHPLDYRTLTHYQLLFVYLLFLSRLRGRRLAAIRNFKLVGLVIAINQLCLHFADRSF